MRSDHLKVLIVGHPRDSSSRHLRKGFPLQVPAAWGLRGRAGLRGSPGAAALAQGGAPGPTASAPGGGKGEGPVRAGMAPLRGAERSGAQRGWSFLGRGRRVPGGRAASSGVGWAGVSAVGVLLSRKTGETGPD